MAVGGVLSRAYGFGGGGVRPSLGMTGYGSNPNNLPPPSVSDLYNAGVKTNTENYDTIFGAYKNLAASPNQSPIQAPSPLSLPNVPRAMVTPATVSYSSPLIDTKINYQTPGDTSAALGLLSGYANKGVY